jgi:hypothetical protein
VTKLNVRSEQEPIGTRLAERHSNTIKAREYADTGVAVPFQLATALTSVIRPPPAERHAPGARTPTGRRDRGQGTARHVEKRRSTSMLEELDGTLELFGLCSALERAEVPSFAAPWVPLSRIEAIFP